MGAIVLAGGRSRRMGRAKALLPFGNARLVDAVVERVRAVASPVVVVTAAADALSPPQGARVVPDLYPGAGPLGGLITGLFALGDGYHVAVACDMPHLSVAVLRLLLAAAEGFDAAVPEIDGRLEPLCAVYHGRCRQPLADALAAGERALHRAVRRLHLRSMAERELRAVDPALDSLTNVNTPDEYRAATSDAVGHELTHLDPAGNARMVDVSQKSETERTAVARGRVRLAPDTVRMLREGRTPKGDVLAAARIAGILGAKRTGELIPLCHPLPLTHAAVEITLTEDGVEIEANASVTGRTGVEMEALTAVSVAALTVYDMVKAVDRGAIITDIRLVRKTGGKSGEYVREEP